MNWLNKIMRCSAALVALVILSACGVKGDPLPPEKPAELGRGRPTYKRATEGIRIEKVKKTADEEEDEDDDDRK